MQRLSCKGFFIHCVQNQDLVKKFTYLFITALLLCSVFGLAQDPTLQNIGNRIRQIGGGGRSGGGTDSLKQRNKNEDSITIYYRYLDSAGTYKLDSSVGDFTRRFPLPATHIMLGNLGNASRSLLFSPVMSAGFNPGFTAFDI